MFGFGGHLSAGHFEKRQKTYCSISVIAEIVTRLSLMLSISFLTIRALADIDSSFRK